MEPHSHLRQNNEQRTPPVLPHPEAITPTNLKTRASGREDSGALHQPTNTTGEIPSGKFHSPGAFQKSSQLPTPQSPGNMGSYLVTRTPNSAQNFQPDLESTALPTEFRFHASSPPPFRPHLIPTPEPSPLVARSRSSGPHSSSWIARAYSHDEDDFTIPNKRDGLQSRASTPPCTPSRKTPTRPVTPRTQSHPTTSLQRGSTRQWSPVSTGAGHCDSTSSPPLQRVKEEPGGETARFRAQLIENHLASAQEVESRRPDYFKRMKRLPPQNSAGDGGVSSLSSDLGGQDGSLLWSLANVGVIESPVKGKRIALFQETSEESFEESLMAGGYGRYRSHRPWKLDEDAEVPNQLSDAVGEDELGPELMLSEEEKRKKTRLAAFFDPPRVTSSTTQLFPVEIEGCGRVLMKVEPSEPQTPSKPTPKTKRSRKRKKSAADMKPDAGKDNVVASKDGIVDGPNWPDTEFPWRSRFVVQDGLSGAEREQRLQYLESFFDRDSDEDDSEERYSSSSRRSLDEVPSRSPRPGRGKTYPLLSHSKDGRHGTTTLSVVPSDPADARTALLSKKAIRAVQLRLLRRRNTRRCAGGDDDGEVLCVCRGRDDGRSLVQCDACRTWYHLECIGIQSTSELGREEDPWFCGNCGEVKTPPPVVALPEPRFVPTDDDGHGIGGGGSKDVGGTDPPFLNAGLNPSPVTPWTRTRTRTVRPPTTPPRRLYVPYIVSGTSWDEPTSSSSHGDPRTPQFNTASGFGDVARVYGMTPGPSSSTLNDESPFDPTSTPSRGIRFGLPFTTPKDGKWGVRGGGHELFHTPKHAGEDGGHGVRYGPSLTYHGDVSEERRPGLHRTTGANNITPIERGGLSGVKRMQALESPLGGKRTRRPVGS